MPCVREKEGYGEDSVGGLNQMKIMKLTCLFIKNGSNQKHESEPGTVNCPSALGLRLDGKKCKLKPDQLGKWQMELAY